MLSLARGRRIVICGVLAGLAALVLGGCVVFKGPITFTQQSIIGKVRVAYTVCATGQDDGAEPGGPGEDHPGCPDSGNQVGSPGSGGTYQVLTAVRVPAGTKGPQAFTAT